MILVNELPPALRHDPRMKDNAAPGRVVGEARRARQEEVTTELIDVVTGAEALLSGH